MIVKGAVTAAKGFLASGVKAGIKKSGRMDLALLYSEVPAVAAAAFTTNRFKSSHIKLSLSHLGHKTHQAIIANSGNANCVNGKSGDRDALLMTDYVAKFLGLDREEVLVASTGIIGKPLPMDKIKKAIPSLAGTLTRDGGRLFAETIMTTDTRTKEFAVKVKVGSVPVTIGGACKGAGMIYPNMEVSKHATLLSFVTTDVSISKKMLTSSLGEAVKDSFNMVSIDGEMSTNDSFFLMANGLAGNKRITAKDGSYHDFTKALKYLSMELAKMVVRDGEGATKFVQIEVTGAKREDDARIIARKISTSNLLKCCIFGQDPNWGRIIASAGSSGVGFDPGRIDVYLGGVKVVSNGSAVKGYDLHRTKAIFKKSDISIRLDLKAGKARATGWTCDLSDRYVAINSEYST